MMELLMGAVGVGGLLYLIWKIARKIKAARTFNAKRHAKPFRRKPFLWMRRIF
ncbi:MAG: hypothetical protein QNJ22_16245 [Desulfosarcinaceae bacterium]|nr:hypothetical protein [Desulfosarcinaceae bacterium]